MIAYGPIDWPGRSVCMREPASISYAGDSMKSPEWACASSSASTSERSATSLAHASSRKAFRSRGSRSSADSSRALICCHRSRVICGFVRLLEEHSHKKAPKAQNQFESWTLELTCFCAFLWLKFTIEPGLCTAPFPFDGRGRNVQHFCDLFNSQTAEEAEFHDTALLRVDKRQRVQGIIQRNHLGCFLLRDGECLVQLEFAGAAASLCTSVAASMIDEDRAHQLSGDSKEVSPVLPLDA